MPNRHESPNHHAHHTAHRTPTASWAPRCRWSSIVGPTMSLGHRRMRGAPTMLQQFDERNRDIIVNVGGRLTHRDQAAVSPFDSAVQGGDAVWEGLRLHQGRIFRLTEHLTRLRRSAQALAFESVPPDEEIIAEIRRTLAA